MATADAVYAALPDDGAFRAFATIAEATGLPAREVRAALEQLAAAGRAELVHGRGWRRPGLGSTNADPRDAYVEEVIAPVVARAGHVVQYVSGDADRGIAPFAYTVGLLGRLGFELIVTGALPPDTLQGMLNSAAALDPFPRERGVQVARVMMPPYMAVLLDTHTERCEREGYPLNIARAWWRRAEERADHVLRAFGADAAGPAAHRWERFPVVQVLWPDRDFRYPWHARYAYAGELGGQPLLGDPPVPR